MRFVYGKHTYFEFSRRILTSRLAQYAMLKFGKQTLRRNIKQIVFTLISTLCYFTIFQIRNIAVQSSCFNAVCTQAFYLVFHERDKRRNHNNSYF